MLQACSRCGKIHPYNYICNVGKYRKFTDTTENKLRSKSAWQTKRRSIRERAFNLCEVCKAQGIYTYDHIEIHHIKKLKEDPDGLLDDSNLIALCIPHHKQADNGELSADYLRELAQLRDDTSQN